MQEFVKELKEKLEQQKGNEDVYALIGGKRLVRRWNLCVDTCKEIVGQVAEEYGDGWIPCSERLPEVDYRKAEYWVTIKVIGFSHVFTKRLEWDCNKKCWKNPNGIAISKVLEVIAWKEIEYPTPYQINNQDFPSNWKQQIMSRFERVE